MVLHHQRGDAGERGHVNPTREQLTQAGWLRPEHDGGYGARRWLVSAWCDPWDPTRAKLDAHVVPMRAWPPPEMPEMGATVERMAWTLARARWRYASRGRTGAWPANWVKMTGWGRPELVSALECGGPLDAPVS